MHRVVLWARCFLASAVFSVSLAGIAVSANAKGLGILTFDAQAKSNTKLGTKRKKTSKRAAVPKLKSKSTASPKTRKLSPAIAGAGLVGVTATAAAVTSAGAQGSKNKLPTDGLAEARLIDIYRLVGAGKTAQALKSADSLVADYPHFQLAQLIHGDLLSARTRNISRLGDVPDTTSRLAAAQLFDLREESKLRLQALRERPPVGSIPAPFVALSTANKHAIAIDVSRARLYLFENTPLGLKLLADYYVSIGKAGTDKVQEGDLRTPLGVYFVTSRLDPKNLKDFYGSGALPINFPSPLDTRRGKSGSGIWLHGTPPNMFSRAPKSTDGCMVIANPDLDRVLATVATRTTPVAISQQLQWVPAAKQQSEKDAFSATLQAWTAAKQTGSLPKLLEFYAPEFNSLGKTLRDMVPKMEADMKAYAGAKPTLTDLSILAWRESGLDAMVVTFVELAPNKTTGKTMRQYWTRANNQWKIVFEGVI